MTPELPSRPLPPNLVRAVADEAERDADRVGGFLARVGLRASPERLLHLPGRFLLGLGAALRLLAWEARGITVHLDAGLPTARQAIRDAFRSVNDPTLDLTELRTAILQLSVERLAWAGPPDLGADVALDVPDEDALLDALADFLWAIRPR